MDDKPTENNDLKKQCVTVTAGTLASSSIQAIVGYIAIWFFKPVWEKIVKLLGWDRNNKNEQS